jgi:beta-lactam-binding protein with PASTA domain
MAGELYAFKKRESLNEQSKEDESVTKTIKLVQKVKAIAEAEKKNTGVNEPDMQIGVFDVKKNVIIKEDDGDVKSGKLKKNKKVLRNNKEPLDKKDKTAIAAAYTISGLIIVGMLVLFMNIFGFDAWAVISHLWYKPDVFLPSVVGQNIEQAKPSLEELGFKVEFTGEENDADKGTVLTQDPGGDMNVKQGAKITLTVSTNSNPAVQITVPNVVNKQYLQAEQELIALELNYSEVYREVRNGPYGFILEQSPVQGTSVAKGSTIVLYVSQEQYNFSDVPNFVGKTIEDAKSLALETGLAYKIKEKDSTTSVGKVLEQDIQPGSKISNSTSITLTVGKEPTPTPIVDTPSPPVETPRQETQNFQVELEKSSATSEVIIKLDGAEVYKKTFNSADNRVTIPITSDGTKKVVITVNGKQSYSANVKFN